MEDYQFDAIVDRLSDVEGGGTWHISLYVRPDKSLQSVKNRITQEVSEAESIKSDDTRDRVQSSLGRILDALDEYKQTPDNGLVVFTSPSATHILDELPFECPENRYHCGKSFLVEPLVTEYDTQGTYGLIVVERGEAAVGVLSRGRVESVTEKESQVMGKTKAGGQSAPRFERVRAKQKHNFFVSVADTAESTFSSYCLDGVVIGGTLSSAKEFSSDYVRHDWNVLGTYSVDHGDEQGLAELVERAENRILDEDEAEVRELVETFLSGLRDDSAEYGRPEVDDTLQQGRVDTLLLSSELSIDEIEEYAARAEQYGSDVNVVNITFEEAEMFEEVSGGYGAILRW